MRIAIFHYEIHSNNPIGSIILTLIKHLCKDIDFTIFAVKFDNPCPDHIKFVRVPAITRPQALLFISYHLIGLVAYILYRLKTKTCYDFILFTESNLIFGDITSVHFCHRAYLQNYWKKSVFKKTLIIRRFLRFLDHWLHAILEPWIFKKVRYILVPSNGLRKELENTYPFTKGKIRVIYNPVDVEYMRPPSDFDREAFRRVYGAYPEDLIFIFVALGHFERKGLHLILHAMSELAIRKKNVKLWVVGGEKDLVKEWDDKVKDLNLGDQVYFFGMQKDIRSFLWASDVFIFPSAYETFCLAAAQAAAAGLPLIITPVYGVEEYAKDGETGFIINRNIESIQKAMDRFINLKNEERQIMGHQAQLAVQRFRVENFIKSWRKFLKELENERKAK